MFLRGSTPVTVALPPRLPSGIYEVCQGCHLRPCPSRGGSEGERFWHLRPLLKSLKSRGLYLVYFSLIEKTNELPGAPSYYRALNYSASSSSSQTTNKDAMRENEKAGVDLLFCRCFGTLHSRKEQMSIIFFKPCLFLAEIFVALAHLFIFQCGLPKFHLLKI